MKTELIELNGNYYKQSDYSARLTLRFHVALTCVHSFLQQSKIVNYKIEKAGEKLCSNKYRQCVLITITNTPYWIQEILCRLRLDETTDISSILQIYRHNFDKSRFNKLPCVMTWKKNKGYKMNRRNVTPERENYLSKKMHSYTLKGCYSY